MNPLPNPLSPPLPKKYSENQLDKALRPNLTRLPLLLQCWSSLLSGTETVMTTIEVERFLIISQVPQRSNCKFVQDQRNVPHNSLVHAFSLSSSSCGIKNTFLGVVSLIFFACALRSLYSDDRLLCDIKTSGKTKTAIAWKVFAA